MPLQWGDDIIVLQPGQASKEIISAVTGSQIPGLRKPFANPLDIVEDERTGNLYITEYYDGNGKGKPYLTLLKADKPATATATVTALFKQATPIEPLKDLTVYPNPTTGERVHVAVQNLIGQASISITIVDAAGRLVHTVRIEADKQGTASKEIVLEEPLKSGFYIIKAHASSGEVRYGKLVVQ